MKAFFASIWAWICLQWIAVVSVAALVAIGVGLWLVFTAKPAPATPAEETPADVVSGDGNSVAGTETFSVPGPGVVNVPSAGTLTFVPAPSAPTTGTDSAPATQSPAVAPAASFAPAVANDDLVDGLSAVAGHVSDHETRMNSIETRLGAIESAKAAALVAPVVAPTVSASSLSDREKGLRRSFRGPMRNVTESLYWSLVRDGMDPQPTETDSDDFRKWLAEMSVKYAGSKSKKAKP